MTLRKRLLAIGVLLLLSPLLIPALAVLLFYSLCLAISHWLWLCWFCWNDADRVYLICSRRRGWEAFLKNNAAPALPPHVTAVWLEVPGQWRKVIHAVGLSGRAISKPYLLLVTPLGLKFAPLNERLQSLKSCGQAAETARTQSRQTINATLQEFAAYDRAPSA